MLATSASKASSASRRRRRTQSNVEHLLADAAFGPVQVSRDDSSMRRSFHVRSSRKSSRIVMRFGTSPQWPPYPVADPENGPTRPAAAPIGWVRARHDDHVDMATSTSRMTRAPGRSCRQASCGLMQCERNTRGLELFVVAAGRCHHRGSRRGLTNVRVQERAWTTAETSAAGSASPLHPAEQRHEDQDVAGLLKLRVLLSDNWRSINLATSEDFGCNALACSSILGSIGWHLALCV